MIRINKGTFKFDADHRLLTDPEDLQGGKPAPAATPETPAPRIFAGASDKPASSGPLRVEGYRGAVYVLGEGHCEQVDSRAEGEERIRELRGEQALPFAAGGEQ